MSAPPELPTGNDHGNGGAGGSHPQYYAPTLQPAGKMHSNGQRESISPPDSNGQSNAAALRLSLDNLCLTNNNDAHVLRSSGAQYPPSKEYAQDHSGVLSCFTGSILDSTLDADTGYDSGEMHAAFGPPDSTYSLFDMNGDNGGSSSGQQGSFSGLSSQADFLEPLQRHAPRSSSSNTQLSGGASFGVDWGQHAMLHQQQMMQQPQQQQQQQQHVHQYPQPQHQHLQQQQLPQQRGSPRGMRPNPVAAAAAAADKPRGQGYRKLWQQVRGL